MNFLYIQYTFYAWWYHDDMEILAAVVVEQIVDVLVVWNALMLMWRHCNDVMAINDDVKLSLLFYKQLE